MFLHTALLASYSTPDIGMNFVVCAEAHPKRSSQILKRATVLYNVDPAIRKWCLDSIAAVASLNLIGLSPSTTGHSYICTAAVALLMTGCALNAPSPALEEARAVHRAMQSNPSVGALAPAEFTTADEALHRAEAVWFEHSSAARIAAAAQVARQRAAVATETARLRDLEQQLAAVAVQRQTLALEADNRRAARTYAQALSAVELDQPLDEQRWEAKTATDVAKPHPVADIGASVVAARLDPLSIGDAGISPVVRYFTSTWLAVSQSLEERSCLQPQRDRHCEITTSGDGQFFTAPCTTLMRCTSQQASIAGGADERP